MTANLPDRTPARELRASDADRERVAAILRDAAAEGRLHLDELDERLAQVYAARTYAELEPVTADLPAHAYPAPVADRVGGTSTDSAAIAIMGGFERKGRWVVPADFRCLAFWGGGELDLREARFAQREVVIHAYACMGGISIVVPEDIEVVVTGTGIMGGFDHEAVGPGLNPGGPRVTITGIAFWGGVSVTRRPPREEELRRREERRRAKLERRQARRLERGR